MKRANKFLTSNVKGEDQGHVKDQNNIFVHNFCSICRTDFQLVSYHSLWKGISCVTLILIFDLDLNNFIQNQSFQQDWREPSTPSRIVIIKFLVSKVKGKGQGHVKGQNNPFGHNFGSICHIDLQLVIFANKVGRRLCFDRRVFIYLFIYLFACDSHNSKTTQPIFLIFGGMIGHNSRTIWLDFGSDQVKGQGQGGKKGLFAITLSIFSWFAWNQS